MSRLTVGEAAKVLGISDNAVRMRVQRGKLIAHKVDNTLYVEVDNEETKTNDDHTANQTLLVETLQDQIDYLKQELAQAHESNRELRRLLAALTQRLPMIEGSTEPASHERTEAVQSTPPPAPTTPRKSFIRRLLG